MENNDIDILGRKTFFIAPDPAMIPETYLEQFMSHGFETYIIRDDNVCPLDKKVESIISLYYGAIILFYVDADVLGIEWRGFIQNLQKQYGDRVLLGVLFAKRSAEAIREQRKLEEFFNMEVRLPCGTLPLERRSKENFIRLTELMSANRANGRRKSTRALCDEQSTMTFSANNKRYRAHIVDVSISHFSCELDDQNGMVPIYDKMLDVTLNVNGFIFNSDVVLIMKRIKSGVNLCVYMFIKKDGSPDLEGEAYEDLNHKIYDMVSSAGKKEMRKAFDKAIRENSL